MIQLKKHQSHTPALLTLRNIGKSFDGESVLDGLSFAADQGEIAVLMGPSGCGKTTTLRLVAGLEAPDTGEIILGDNLVSSPERLMPPYDRQVAMVFQDPALWPHMTAAQHIDFVLGAKRYGKKERAIKIEKLLNLAQVLKPYHYPYQLSGGEQQRLAIARALAAEPKVLLMDEPFTHLDEELKITLLAQTRNLLQEQQITTLYVTHQQQEAAFMADQVLIMANGRVQHQYSRQEFDRLSNEIVTNR